MYAFIGNTHTKFKRAVRLLLLLATLGRGSSSSSSSLSTTVLLLVKGRVTAGLVKHVGGVALSAVRPVEMVGHEDTRTAALLALLPEAGDLAALLVHLVVLQNSELHLLVLVLDLLGLGVSLLLPLLAASEETEGPVPTQLGSGLIKGQDSEHQRNCAC